VFLPSISSTYGDHKAVNDGLDFSQR